MEHQTIHQPVHPSVRPHSDPAYIAFHEQHLQYVQPDQEKPWHPSLRSLPSPLALGALPFESVGSIRDRDFGGWQVRVFTPGGSAAEKGWPALVWFHGGGWVMGGLGSENSFLTAVCRRVCCAVVSVSHRHAPENPYPAAIDDAVAALQWVISDEGKAWLGVDTQNISVGGLSAGGCLAAILSMTAAMWEPKVDLRSQILLLPVIDNTATIETTWKESQHAPWLTPARMTWYREKYFQDASDAACWEGSPCCAPRVLLARSPRTFLAVAECDLLAPEARAYACLLRDAGVEVAIKEYRGGTHSLLVLAGMIEKGKEMDGDVVRWLSEAPCAGLQG